MEPVLTVTAAAENRRWVVLQTVKDALDIPSTDSSEDTELDRYLVAASLALAGPAGLNRPPWLQSYVEDRPGDGSPILDLTQWPIVDDPPVVTFKGTAVTLEDYSVRGIHRDHLFMGGSCWQLTQRSSQGARVRPLDYSISYSAGWVVPGQFAPWVAGTTYAVGDWVTRETDDPDDPLLFRCSVAGLAGPGEPTWATGYGDATVDNLATWNGFPQRLPPDLQLAATVCAVEWYRGGLDVPAGILSEGFRGHRVTYRPEPGSIPPQVMGLLAQYRVPVGAS